jgi:MEMO1 family protein
MCLCLLGGVACSRQKTEPAQTTSSVASPERPSAASRARAPSADSPSTPGRPAAHARAREPAVAGSFYPADPSELRSTVDRLLAQVKARNLKGLRALVCPHAGYEFSGPVAASGFKQMVGLDIERVVVMAPSHHVPFAGVAIPDVDALRTPLGDITMNPWARELAKESPFLIDSRPHAREHALEVELPFLQRVLSRFELVPLVFGEVDEALVAQRLNAGLDAKTFVIASSDLSHYYPYEKAVELDRGTVQAIVRLDVESLAQREACGRSPVMALVHLAKLRGWKTELLDYRNSGDTAGDRSRVVGYSAVAFLEKG